MLKNTTSHNAPFTHTHMLFTDLPTIVSGNRLAYLDPHEELWARETGKWYDINMNTHFTDSFAPFEGLCGFSVRNHQYNGTLFRFPLRNVMREKRVSSHTYDIHKLRDLLHALRNEAKCILIFLRSVRTVEVFEIGENGARSNILKISISELPHDRLGQRRANFQVNLKRSFAAQSFGIRDTLTDTVHVQVEVTHYGPSTRTESSKWLVSNQVGTKSDEVRRMAKDLKVFPWVSVALETSASPTRIGGRVFCVLPLPIEVTCGLPVYVNGTFSLNDERRELKWRGIERQNDPSALWNHLLVKELLPACYATLLLQHAKLLVTPDQFCQAWPDASKVKGTHWGEMLSPLLQALFSDSVIPFCKPGGFPVWIKVSSATFVPRGVTLPEAVATALVACGVKLVTAADTIWNAIQFCNIAHTIVSPSLTRAQLKRVPNSYTGLSRQQKLQLLQYCLSDCQYGDLQNIVLLPLANGNFACFGTASFNSAVYLCSSQCPHYLLPTLQGELVDENTDYHLYTQLETIAKGRYNSNLQVLTINTVAILLQRVLPNQNKLALPYSHFNMEWLRQFWGWVSGANLRLFQNLLLVPVGDSSVVKLSKQSAALFVPSTQSYGQPIITALEKLGVDCCLQRRHQFVCHSSYLSPLMNCFSAMGILDAIRCASPQYRSISLTREEASELITQIHSVNLNWEQTATLREIPMFSTLQNTKEQLHSVAQVEQMTGRGAEMEPPSFPLSAHNLPSSIVLFSASNYYLLQKLSISCTTTVNVLVQRVFPMVANGSLGRNAAKKMMEEVLTNYYPITSKVANREVQSFQRAISQLPFVPVSVGKPKPPNMLYSPDPELRDIFSGEPVFPSSPFSEPRYVKILKLCGLKMVVSKQEIVDIISSIASDACSDSIKVDSVKHTRAKAIIAYIKRWEHELSESVTIAGVSRRHYPRCLRFPEALKELSEIKSWLPVQCSPPQNYPSCLAWKGRGCSSHLVSFGSSVLLCKDQASLALACGSQMHFVEHSLPQSLCNTFAPISETLVRHIMAHLEEVILNCQKFQKTEEVTRVVLTIYGYLNKYSSEGCKVELSQLCESKECVWLSRQKKFVHPHNTALAQHEDFQHNLEPFLYILPDDLARFESLFQDLGVQESITREQILAILPRIKEGDSQSLEISDKQAWQLVMAIFHWLTDTVEEVELDTEVLVPVQSDKLWPQLVSAEDVVYTDNDYLQRFLESSDDGEAEFMFVHSRITPQMAVQLQLTPLSEHLNIAEDAFEDVGQSEPLTVRLRNILKDYKDGLTIVKELLQNADDAGASEMNVCYDRRSHSTDRKALFLPGMAECHGPALVVNNNAMFTEEDFENITKLAGATKERQTLKIGKFGIGFCSVYHITDIPSFVSNELLYIFDPTLKYLAKEIKNPARPGKKIRFSSQFIRRSKQLIPYAGLYGFDLQHQCYEGTTFRFPFRTGASELSEKIYTEHDVKELMEQMRKSSSKLVIFLQKIKSITFSQITSGQEEPSEMMRITKHTEVLNDCRCIHQITCSVTGSADATEYWLVETCSETILEKYSTASVACSLSPLSTKDHFKAEQIEGEMFCFLPLSVKTGLPVHVSSNFAVSNNRRGIWASDESDSKAQSDEVEWNVSLMGGAICSAYCGLLEALKELYSETKLEDYEYFSMWPVEEELKVHNPWDLSVEAVYEAIEEGKELLFSTSTLSWLTLNKSRFLDPNILRVSHGKSIPAAVLDIVNHLEMPVVHLPKKYHKHLDLTESMETERAFLEHFFHNVNELEDVQGSRNDVLCLALECYGCEMGRKTEERFLYLQELLESNACVPCAPDGVELKKPKELIHPEAKFAKLFDVDENLFPLQQFCDNVHVDIAMKDLGLLHSSIPLQFLEERAIGIAELYKAEKVKAMERSQLIIECLMEEDKRESLSPEKCSKLSQIPFLPAMEKPEDYLLQWKGDTTQTLQRGCDMFMSDGHSDSSDGRFHDMANVFLAGSQLVFLNQEPPSKGGCATVHWRVQELLQIHSSPSCTDVIAHFHHLIEEFDGTKEMIKQADRISRNVYEFLDKHLTSTELEESRSLAEKPCIWTGQRFVECSVVAQKWSHKGPYLFKVPVSLERRKHLIKALGIRETFEVKDMVVALRHLKDDFGDDPLPDNCRELVKSIIMKMPTAKLDAGMKPIMLPDEEFALHESTELYHNDMPWVAAKEEYRYVHWMVPLATAVAMGVQLCRAASLAKYSVSDSGFTVMEFGQHEELTRRIQNIIRDYPFDMTILKELLQNADDAKATKMHVILDMRKHSEEHLLSENWSELQGPALLVWNDSVFTEADLKGIQRLGLGSKRSDSETIGQYGIGFNAVYHLTDCPSFLTGGDTLCILDPHMKYVPEATMRHPGTMYSQLDDSFWNTFDGMKPAYLRDDIKNRPKELLGGTLFRFPLRHTWKHVRTSEIVKDLSGKADDRVITAEKLCDLLEEWAPSMKQSLLFLNHVVELKFFIIKGRRGVMYLQNGYRTELDDTACKRRSELTHQMKSFDDAASRTPFITTYPLTIVESQVRRGKDVKEEWLIQQGIGDVENKATTWKYVEHVRPKHGLAAPLRRKRAHEFRGQVFCFLPLPQYTDLPVHINGHFILNSTRRNLWTATDPEREDGKSHWNRSLLQAVASSYAQFLQRIPEYFPELEGCSSRESLEVGVTNYYVCFPRISDKVSEPWLQVAQQVFQVLSKRNSPVLAVPTNMSPRASEDKYLLQWHPLKSEKMPASQVYFHEEKDEKNLRSIFERTGMKITCAPKWIRWRFQKVQCDIPAISKSSVYNFYVQFHKRFISAQFPCPIQDTPFKCVKDFKTFTEYLLQSVSLPGSSKLCTFPKEPFGYPLLLNADEQLCIFDQANKILCSKFFKLFPSCQAKFLHPAFIDCSLSRSYFVSMADPVPVCAKIVKELLETVLPVELKNAYVSAESDAMTKFDIKCLWKCFTDDEVFRRVLDEMLKVWALLLTEDRRLYRRGSSEQLLPIIADSSSSIVAVLNRQLKAPMLDTDIVPKGTVDSLCPKVSDHKAILLNLVHLHREFPFFEVLTVKSAGILIDYFMSINFKREVHCCQQIMRLPLFETMDGNLTILQGKRVYIWPTNICQEGNEQWLMGTDLVFLNPFGAWSRLGVNNELGIKAITPEETYVQFIFPNFFKMCKKDRYCHLKYIRDLLFNQNFSCKDNSIPSSRFISALQGLPCIGDDGLPLKAVGHFYNHQKEIFRTFPERFQTLPNDLLKGEVRKWMPFFKKLGLQETVSTDMFLALCKDVATGKLREKTEAGSKVLLDFLLSAEEAKHHKFHNKPQFLSKSSQVPFVCPVPMPELEWICKVPTAPNRVILANGTEVPLCILSGSCCVQYKHLVWTVRPIVEVVPTTPEEVQVLKNLGVCVQPTPKDLMESVRHISKTCFSDHTLFTKYKVPQCKPGHKHLVDVMANMFEHLQTFSDVDVTELKSLRCVPVYAISSKETSQYPVLVEPWRVVSRAVLHTKQYYPFIHSLNSRLYKAKEFLERVGVQDSIELEHMQIVLESAFTISESGAVELDPNTKEVISCAVVELNSLLEKNTEGREQKGKQVLVEKLKPLYLPGADSCMHPIESLVYSMIRNVNLEGTDLCLLWTPRDHGVFPQRFCELLPKDLRPRALSELCIKKVSESCEKCDNIPKHVSDIETTLRFQNLQNALYLVVKSSISTSLTHSTDLEKQILNERFQEHMTRFFEELKICCVQNLRVDLFLKEGGASRPVASEKEYCVIQEQQNTCYLYINAKVTLTRLGTTQKCIAKWLTSCLINDLKERDREQLTAFMAELLSSETSDEIYTALQEKEIKCDDISPNEPRLGDNVHPSWFDRLDMSNQNIFQSQEWVGYKPQGQDETYVFAQVSHPVCLRDASGQPLTPMQMEYIIFTSEDDTEGKKVKAIDLYKFMTGDTAPEDTLPPPSESQEVVPYEGEEDAAPPPAPAPPINLQEARDEVRRELEEIWRLPQPDRRRAIHRLYLKWHPDKNLRNPGMAEEVFKFIQEELDRLERGDGVSVSDNSGPYQSWRDSQRTWNFHARQHRNYQQQARTNRGGGGGGGGGGGRWGGTGGFFSQQFTPSKNEREAKRWVRQAVADHSALQVLLHEAQTNFHLHCHVCFMAHEVAEKALKGAMYATCGLRAKTRASHNIIPLAYAVEQAEPQTARGISTLAEPLESTYSDETLFPKENAATSPFEDFTSESAMEAERCATRILKIVRDIVNVEM